MGTGNDSPGERHALEWDRQHMRGSAARHLDAFLSVLADARRREVVRLLAEHDRGLTERELAGALADGRLQEERAEDERRIRSELRHRHLPKLEEAEFVVRGEEGHIFPTEHCDLAVDVLDAIEEALRPHAAV